MIERRKDKNRRGLKDNTFQNYQYMYNQFVYPDFGQSKVGLLKRSDVRRFYNMLLDERGLKIATIDNIHTVLHQVLNLAVEDDYLRKNPADYALKELKQARNLETEKRRALTLEEQNMFLNYFRNKQAVSPLVSYFRSNAGKWIKSWRSNWIEVGGCGSGTGNYQRQSYIGIL